MTATEPNGWELKRSLDQMREDAKEDRNDLKDSIDALGARLEKKLDALPTSSDLQAMGARVGVVEGRMTTLEQRADKRSEKASTQWLMWGIAILGALTSIVCTIVTVVVASR